MFYLMQVITPTPILTGQEAHNFFQDATQLVNITSNLSLLQVIGLGILAFIAYVVLIGRTRGGEIGKALMTLSALLTQYDIRQTNLEKQLETVRNEQDEKREKDIAIVTAKQDKLEQAIIELVAINKANIVRTQALENTAHILVTDGSPAVQTIGKNVTEVLRLIKDIEGLGAQVEIIKTTSATLMDTATRIEVQVKEIELLQKAAAGAQAKLTNMQRELNIVQSDLTKKRETTDKLPKITIDDSRPLPPLTPQQEAT